MERYIKEYRQRETPEVSFGAIYNYMISAGFQYLNYAGEQVFKKGDGWVSGPNFVKITYGPDTVRVEAWIKFAVLPGHFTGEIGMFGVVGVAAKGPIRAATGWIDQYLGGQAYALTVGEDVAPGRPLTLVPNQYLPQPQQPAGYIPQPVRPYEEVPAQPVAAFCANCGAALNPGAVFCGACGAHVE